jgi:polar amino acid transport system substrate-binding protein
MMASSAAAQVQGSLKLRVAVAILPPFVIQQNGTLTGFSIDLWNAVAARLNIKSDYQTVSGAESLIASMRSKKADIVVSPVAITAARDQEFDFSLPIIQAGFQIMVRDTGETAATNPLEDLLRLLFSKTTVLWLGIALALVLIPAHLVWLLERRPRLVYNYLLTELRSPISSRL